MPPPWLGVAACGTTGNGIPASRPFPGPKAFTFHHIHPLRLLSPLQAAPRSKGSLPFSGPSIIQPARKSLYPPGVPFDRGSSHSRFSKYIGQVLICPRAVPFHGLSFLQPLQYTVLLNNYVREPPYVLFCESCRSIPKGMRLKPKIPMMRKSFAMTLKGAAINPPRRLMGHFPHGRRCTPHSLKIGKTYPPLDKDVTRLLFIVKVYSSVILVSRWGIYRGSDHAKSRSFYGHRLNVLFPAGLRML